MAQTYSAKLPDNLRSAGGAEPFLTGTPRSQRLLSVLVRELSCAALRRCVPIALIFAVALPTLARPPPARVVEVGLPKHSLALGADKLAHSGSHLSISRRSISEAGRPCRWDSSRSRSNWDLVMQKFRRTILAVFICIKLAHYPYRHNCFFYFFFFFRFLAGWSAWRRKVVHIVDPRWNWGRKDLYTGKSN